MSTDKSILFTFYTLIALLILSCMSLTVFSQVPVLYLNSDYSGASLSLTASYPDTRGQDCIRDWRQHMVSIRVPKGWMVELFTGANYTGASISLTSDVPELSILEWEEKTASIRVSHVSVLGDQPCPCMKAKSSPHK